MFLNLIQQRSYRIFVISQDDQEVFNRAMLFNVGYSEAVKLSDWDCLGEGTVLYLLSEMLSVVFLSVPRCRPPT